MKNWRATPVGGGMGMKCRKPFSPKAKKIRPSSRRAISDAIFISVSSFVEFCCSETRVRVHFFQRRCQESVRIDFAGHQLSGASSGYDGQICDAYEAEHCL